MFHKRYICSVIFDPGNPIVALCAEGIGKNDLSERLLYIEKAWNSASSDIEKCVSAHFMGHVIADLSEKLKWQHLALEYALKSDNLHGKQSLSTLYLHIGKIYLDMGLKMRATEYLQLAYSEALHIENTKYNAKIKQGILAAMQKLLIS